jgi:hypothetical protein
MDTNVVSNQQTLIKPVTCNNLKDVPNSWGHQRYEGKYLRVSVDSQRDVNNNLARYGTLRDFVIRNIEGIKLKGKQSVDFCKNCTCQGS